MKKTQLVIPAWKMIEEQYPTPMDLSELRWKDVMRLMVDFAIQEWEKQNVNTYNVESNDSVSLSHDNDVYRNIKTREHYDFILQSGMFWEIHPELTGDWEKDKLIINKKVTLI